MLAPRHRAPLTLELIVRVNDALSLRAMTRGDFRLVLNQFLPESRQIPDTHSGTVKLNRWMNTSGNDWCEPFGEIALAMKLALEKITEKSVD